MRTPSRFIATLVANMDTKQWNVILLKRKIKRVPLKRKKCQRCKRVGHTTKFCHSIRCFKCEGFGHKAKNCMNPKKQYNQKEDARRSQRRDLKREDVQTLESKMPRQMSLKMEFEKIHKNLRNTTVQMKKVFFLC